MAGILDKKTRIFDYILTKEGRSQLKDNGDLRFVYATISDKSIEYADKMSVEEFTYNDAESTFTKSSNRISDSERLYLGFEASSNFSDKLNPEIDLTNQVSYPKYTNDIIDVLGLNNFPTTGSIDKIVTSITGSFIDKFLSLKIIDTWNQIDEQDILIKDSKNLKDKVFDFENKNLESYPTILSKDIAISKEDSLVKDLRFSHKKNYKKLIPVNLDNTPLFGDEDILDIKTAHKFLFKKYENNINEISDLNRDNIIRKLIKSIESDNSVYKSSFEIDNPTERDTFLIQVYESSTEETTSFLKKVDKLIALDIGEIYFPDLDVFKKIILYGKIYKKSNTVSTLRNKFSPIYEKEYTLGSDYSFFNIFTLVIE